MSENHSHLESHGPPTQTSDGSGGMDWTNPPTELLMMIFNMLKGDGGRLDIRWSMRTRLVHPRWKLVMEELLEKWCLEFWTKWEPENFYTCSHNPYSFPTLIHKRDFNGIYCPPYLLKENGPTPTKSVQITERDQIEGMVESDFSKYGAYLTSLLFSDMSSSNPVPLKTLASVLNSTPNLKAFSLQKMHLVIDDRSPELIVLPPIPHLEHIKICHVSTTQCHSTFDFIDWLLKPYKKQLVTFETDGSFNWNPNDDLVAYQKLSRLTVLPPSAQLLHSEVVIPSLQCLSLMSMETVEKCSTTIQLVQKFVTQFSTTLVDFHLAKDVCSEYDFKKFTEKKGEDGDVAFGPPITNITFSLLKKFGILYPRTSGEVEVVKGFLRMFPALETLNFWFALMDADRDDNGYLNWKTAKDHLIEQQYWKICPNLKTIMVDPRHFSNDRVFKIKAPFT